MNDIWQLLGIEATANQEHIKTAYSALNQELEEDLEPKEAECQQSSFEKTFEDWGVEFEEDSEEPSSWAELVEQFRLAEEVEDLVDELSNRLGLMFSFQTFNLTLENFNQHPLFTNEEVKRGLEEHCLNAFILGKWTDRMEAVRRSRELGPATLATYLEKVGLSEQEMKIGKDTRLEGWQER